MVSLVSDVSRIALIKVISTRDYYEQSQHLVNRSSRNDDVHLLFLIAKDLVTFARSDIYANDISAK